MGTCLLALIQLSTLLFGTHCLGNSAAHNGPGLLTSINNQDNSSQICPRSQYDTYNSFLKFSSQVALGCVKLMLKPSGDPCYQREIAEWIESEKLGLPPPSMLGYFLPRYWRCQLPGLPTWTLIHSNLPWSYWGVPLSGKVNHPSQKNTEHWLKSRSQDTKYNPSHRNKGKLNP